MKKILPILFTFLISIYFAQKKEIVDLKFRLKDSKTSTKSLTVLDIREDKTISNFTYKDVYYDIEFPTDNAKSDIESWFNNDNTKRGLRDLVLVVDQIKVVPFKDLEYTCAKINVDASVLEKKNDQYHLVKVFNEMKCIRKAESQNIGKSVASGIGMIFFRLITSSYELETTDIQLKEEDLPEYKKFLEARLVALSSNTLQDGIYISNSDFFNQKPKKFKMDKDSKGNIVRFIVGNEKIYPNKVFGYVENGQAFKYTFEGFLPLLKDENGYYVISSNDLLLHPEEISNMAISHGAIGAVGDIIYNNYNKKRREKLQRKNIYINPLTGNYVID